MTRSERLIEEAQRVYARYAREVVEALSACPFARAARLAGHVCPTVVLGAHPSVATVLEHVDRLERDQDVEIGLLIFPELALDRVPFRHFGSEVRAEDERRKPKGGTIFAIADFHPNAEADLETPGRLVKFLRRTPDPTFQLVRRTVLEAVRRGESRGTPLDERIAQANHATAVRLGIEHLEHVIDDIEQDRHRSYEALGYALPTWARR